MHFLSSTSFEDKLVHSLCQLVTKVLNNLTKPPSLSLRELDPLTDSTAAGSAFSSFLNFFLRLLSYSSSRSLPPTMSSQSREAGQEQLRGRGRTFSQELEPLLASVPGPSSESFLVLCSTLFFIPRN